MAGIFSKKKPRYYRDKDWKSGRPLVDSTSQQHGFPFQSLVATAPFGQQPAMPTRTYYLLPQAGSNVPGYNMLQQGGAQLLIAPPAMPLLVGGQQPQVPMTHPQMPMVCYPMLVPGQYPQIPAQLQFCPDPSRHNLPPPARKITNGEE